MSAWNRVSSHAIQCGNQIISKNYCDGCTLYVLWHGDKRIGHYEHVDDAKAQAEALAQAELVKGEA